MQAIPLMPSNQHAWQPDLTNHSASAKIKVTIAASGPQLGAVLATEYIKQA